MTQLNSTSFREIFQEALKEDKDFIKELLERLLQEFMEEERNQQVGVSSYVRDKSIRKATRNGYKSRNLNTRVGNLKLEKPQIREFTFHTHLFENYQRSERALLLAIQQMVIDGVSTNRVEKIVERLSPDLSFSKSTVSRLTQELDPLVEKWRKENLEGHYIYLFSDASYFYVRENNQVVKRPLLISMGIDTNGYRKILGVDMALEESSSTWAEHFKSLKERGLKTLGLTISDAHKGLVKAQEEEFPGTPHQRCMVHWERNLLFRIPAKERKELARYIKQIYTSPNKKMAFDVAQLIATFYQDRYPRVSLFLEEELEGTLTFFDYPDIHQRKIRTTNLIEGVLNKALKQRSKVIGIFPNRESCLRYACLRLMEIDEDWQTGRKYMKMIEDEDSDTGEGLIKDINKIKQGVSVKEELVVC
jgi:transposase-like protein